jgi:LruC domain-containing protein
MSNGHRLSIGRFAAGTSIGFFIAANGFSYYDGVKTSAVPYYYSLKHLNPDPPALRQHNVLLYDDAVSEVIIGFEDLPRSWGDNDFNDAIFSVRATPETAIDSSELVAVPDVNDSDADGVVDAEDEFPDDYNRAYSTYYPSASGWVSLAYEDGWPSVGDYDMNDLVVRERFQVTYSASDEITGFVIQGYIDARGASYHNGFALRLLGKSPSLMASARLTIDGREYNKTPEADQSDLVLSLWRDSHVHTQTGESGACSHFNTRKTCTQFAPVAFSLDVSFSSPPETLRHADLDFFIYRTDNRAREIHMADFPPTDLFDQSQFGRFDDTSVPAAGRYFRNAQNLPWALQIPTAWRHPREYIDIVWAYPDYENWVESAGVEANDWFSTSERDTHYY